MCIGSKSNEEEKSPKSQINEETSLERLINSVCGLRTDKFDGI